MATDRVVDRDSTVLGIQNKGFFKSGSYIKSHPPN